ncbi:uncharacterized protein LOC131879352 [Tigriopus californicus]|uniref:uncharacterized protein LOC131879352 n=1 Tax=Tigriopus californicus TaxID=6832 RepID=UPI0027D9E4F4|nr:uncharacterized protein LOC131879352 [Tigriopus californicus]
MIGQWFEISLVVSKCSAITMAGSYGKNKKKKKSKPVREPRNVVLKNESKVLDQGQTIIEVFDYFCEFIFKGYGYLPSGISVQVPNDYCISTGFYIGSAELCLKLAQSAEVKIEHLWFRVLLYPNERHLGYGLAHNWLGYRFLEICSPQTKSAIELFWALLWTFTPCMPFSPSVSGCQYANRTDHVLGVLHCAFNTEVERRVALMKMRLPTDHLTRVFDLTVDGNIETLKHLEPVPMTDSTASDPIPNKPVPQALKLDQAKIDALLDQLGSTVITPDLSPPQSEGFETASDGQFSFHSACEFQSDPENFISPPSSPERLGSISDSLDEGVWGQSDVIDKDWVVYTEDGTRVVHNVKCQNIRASDMSVGARTEQNGKPNSKSKKLTLDQIQRCLKPGLARKCTCKSSPTISKCRECLEVEDVIQLVMDQTIGTCTRLIMDLQLYYIHATAMIDAFDPALTRCKICLGQTVADCPFNEPYETVGKHLYEAIFKSSRIVFFANVVRNCQYLDFSLDVESWCTPSAIQMRQEGSVKFHFEPFRLRLYAIATFENVLLKCTEWFLKLQIFIANPTKEALGAEARPLTSLVLNSELVLLLVIGFTNRLGFLGVSANDNTPSMWPTKPIAKFEALEMLGSFSQAAVELVTNVKMVDALGEKLTALEVIYNLHRLNPDGSSLEMFLDYQSAYARRRTICSLFVDVVEHYQVYVDYQYDYLRGTNPAVEAWEQCEMDEWLYHFTTYWNHRFWRESKKLIRSVPKLRLIMENVEKKDNPFMCPVTEKFLELVSRCMFCGKCMSPTPKTCGKCSIARCCSGECWDLVQEVHSLICDKNPDVVLEKFSNLSPYDFSDAMREIYRHENPQKYQS